MRMVVHSTRLGADPIEPSTRLGADDRGLMVWWSGTRGGGGRACVFDVGGGIQPDSCVQNNTLTILRTTA